MHCFEANVLQVTCLIFMRTIGKLIWKLFHYIRQITCLERIPKISLKISLLVSKSATPAGCNATNSATVAVSITFSVLYEKCVYTILQFKKMSHTHIFFTEGAKLELKFYVYFKLVSLVCYELNKRKKTDALFSNMLIMKKISYNRIL